MALKRFVCEFVGCGREFHIPHALPRRFCSRECGSAHKIMEWAPLYVEAKKKGKTHQEIAEELELSRQIARQRWYRLKKQRETNPTLNALLDPEGINND